MPILFPDIIESENSGRYCIKIVTAAIFFNVGFSLLKTLKKIFNLIKEKCLKRSAKIDQLQTSTTSPVHKLDSSIK